MSAGLQRTAAAPARARPAEVGKSWLVVEYKRRLNDLPRWKRQLFFMLRAVLRFCDRRLGLPVIVHHVACPFCHARGLPVDARGGYFRIDYSGTFSEPELALAAIVQMDQDRGCRGDTRFGWQELDLNAVAPALSDRYYAGDFPDLDGRQSLLRLSKAQCPFPRVPNPAETKIAEVVALSSELAQAVSNRNLKATNTQ